MNEEKLKKLIVWGSVLLVIIILVIFTIFKIKKHSQERKIEKQRQEQSSLSENESSGSSKRASNYEEEYTLKVGAAPIKVKLPIWANYECSDPGSTYYIQADGYKKNQVGGGIPYYRQGENSRFFYLSADKKEVNITVYFSPKKK